MFLNLFRCSGLLAIARIDQTHKLNEFYVFHAVVSMCLHIQDELQDGLGKLNSHLSLQRAMAVNS